MFRFWNASIPSNLKDNLKNEWEIMLPYKVYPHIKSKNNLPDLQE